MGVADDVEYRRVEYERHEENSARLAHAYARFTSTGQGSIEFERRVDFDMTFVERPYVAHGHFVDLDTLEEQQDLETGDGPILPLVTAYVTDWDTDDRGFYVGCWCAVRVFYPDAYIVMDLEVAVPIIDSMMPVKIEHDFTFSGTALKDIPMDLTD